MIPDIYINIFYTLGYRPLQVNGNVNVFLKDAATHYKVALLISNYGNARLVSASNLHKIHDQVVQLPEFMYDKKIDFLNVIIHNNRKDQFLAGENIISVAMRGKDCFHKCSNIFADEIAAFEYQRGKVKITEKQLKIQTMPYNNGLSYINLIMIAFCMYLYFSGKDIMKLAISASSVLDQNFYTVFTYMFAHTGIIHLIGNCSALLVLGNMLEKRIGHFKYLVFGILTGVYAGIAAVIYRLFAGDSTVSVGMSGVIFAICSALLIYQYKECKQGYIPIVVYMLSSFLIGLINPYTDNLVHFSGMIAGIAGMILIYAVRFIQKNRINGKYYLVNGYQR